MRRRHALSIAIAAVLGALAIAAIPALAGAKDDHGGRGRDDSGQNHHRHGDRHRHNVGRITAFDAGSGELTITRFGGDTITGIVTSETEIKCEGRDDSARVSRDHGSNSGPGSDNSGRGSSGDDNGGRGEEEPGDDHGEGAEPGDDNGSRGNDGGERVCTTADLTVGAVVHNLDRSFDAGTASFDEVELAPTH